MYYYKVKENSVIEKMMTEDKEAIDKIVERADSFCKKYGFKASAFVTYPVIEVVGFKNPKDNANLELFRKPNDFGEYIPRKRRMSIYAEFQAIGKYKRKLNDFIYSSTKDFCGEWRLTWDNSKKPLLVGCSQGLKQDIIDENLIEITKSEFMKRKEEE